MMIRRTLIATSALIALAAAAPHNADPLALSTLAKVASVDERFQGYNVEMVEVTGGRFWAPYGGTDGEMFRQRAPLDLTDPRLVAIARHLGPALMRVSGTWSNNTYLPAEGEAVSETPAGYKQVLTRQQWRNVIALSKAANAPIVTSFAVSGGTRDTNGAWTTAQAQRIADLTREAGGTLYAAEFFNEPNMPAAALGMPEHYSADDYAREFRVFRDWARKAVPGMKIVGPGGANEGTMFKERHASEPEHPLLKGHIASGEMMKRNPGSLDAVTYHFYGSVSQRCAALNKGTADKAAALTPDWLDRTLMDYRFYADLRDRYEPGKPLWNTETAQAACGGSPWASTFLDTFRYLNQNAVLAQQGVQVVLHNTLATSDYALIDRDTMTPRPNYWAAVLWRRLMGRTVLASPQSPSPQLRLYAQCLRGRPGGVALLALNTGSDMQMLTVPGRASAWTMTGEPLDTRSIRVNGVEPRLDTRGNIVGLSGTAVRGMVHVPATAIAFVAVPGANNRACR